MYGYILSIVYVLPHYHKKTVNFIKEMRKRCSVLNLVFEKVTFLMEDIEKGYLFCDKWYIKRVKDWKLGWSLPTHNFVEYGCPNQFSQGLQTCVSSNSHWNQGSYPFLNKKFTNFSRTFKDTFPIFQGRHSVQKKSLESMSFLVLPQHE